MHRKLRDALEAYARDHGQGQVAGDTQLDWGDVETKTLNPDLAFVSYERSAPYRHVPKSLTWHVVPDLVVEIIRKSEQTEQISLWLDAYFRSGVRRVWVVYPDHSKVHDHELLSSARMLDREDAIDGGDILPGFRLAVRELTEHDNQASSV